jgi:hypothetical protein
MDDLVYGEPRVIAGDTSILVYAQPDAPFHEAAASTGGRSTR